MKKRLIPVVLSVIFFIVNLVFYVLSITTYNEDGWKGIDMDRDYLVLVISSIFVIVIAIMNYINSTKYKKEIKLTAYSCLILNIVYGFYGITKVLSKGVEEIYEGNKFSINIEDLILYSIWFGLTLVTTIILYTYNKKRSLA